MIIAFLISAVELLLAGALQVLLEILWSGAILDSLMYSMREQRTKRSKHRAK